VEVEVHGPVASGEAEQDPAGRAGLDQRPGLPVGEGDQVGDHRAAAGAESVDARTDTDHGVFSLVSMSPVSSAGLVWRSWMWRRRTGAWAVRSGYPALRMGAMEGRGARATPSAVIWSAMRSAAAMRSVSETAGRGRAGRVVLLRRDRRSGAVASAPVS